MKVERLLQINIAALTVVGTLLLGLGQDNPMLPALSLFAAVTSIYFTDTLGWFRLHRVIANLAALGALFISMREFDIFGGNSTSQLRAIANLLVYLQFVLLYQEKNQRVYWQLGVLSLLQVVVAAALDLQVGLGLLLLVYMFTALSAMALLFVYSQIEQVQSRGADADEDARAFAASTLTDPPRAVPHCSEAQILSSMLGWGFLRRLVGIGVATWILALAVFLGTPRLGNAVWRGSQGMGSRSTGFSRDIRLGEMGRILQNADPALTVRILDRAGQPVVLDHALYVRGTALSVYHFDGQQGRWSQPAPVDAFRIAELPFPPHGDWVETRFSLEAPSSDVLFSMTPCYRTEETPAEVRYDLIEEQLIHEKAGPFRTQPELSHYAVATTGVRNGRQIETWPSRPGKGVIEDHFVKLEHDRMVRWDSVRFRNTARLAKELLADAGISSRNRYQAAKTLEAYFQPTGRFTYTLDPAGIPQRPAGVDPVEHFLLAHRRGHCEFFASALVMMLRTQGIPARVVVGYHGGDYNAISKSYLVRQSDAHAWVEVFLEPRHVPLGMRDDLPADSAGAWLRLDPTPEAEQAAGHDSMRPFADTADFLENVWNDYVLGLNSDRQRRAIYRPIVERVRSVADTVAWAAKGLTEKHNWKDLARKFVAWLGVDRPGAGFPWKTSLILGALIATSLVLGRMAWRYLQARGYGRQLAEWRVRRGRVAAAQARGSRVDFYRRFEKILARRRFRRQANQTQKEFAAEVSRATPLAPLVNRVVDAYYRVRFGGRPLDNEEAAAIEKALEELGQTLARRRA